MQIRLVCTAELKDYSQCVSVYVVYRLHACVLGLHYIICVYCLLLAHPLTGGHIASSGCGI